MSAPRTSRRLVDTSILREGFSKLMADTRETQTKQETAEELSQTLEEFAREFEEEKKADAKIDTLADLLPPEAFL